MIVFSRPFWNGQEHRARVVPRILLHLLLLVVVTVGRDAISAGLGSSPMAVIVATVFYVAAGLGITWGMARYIDRRSPTDYGLHPGPGWWHDLVFGLVLGALLMTGVFGSLAWAGWLAVAGPAATTTGHPIALAFALRVIFFSGVAINEELGFRGYELKNLAEGFARGRGHGRGAIALAVLCSSTLFGAVHAANENATVLTTLAIVVAGVLIALPFVLTGSLAMSIGLHLTWNLFQGPVLGFPVSGNAPSTHLITIAVTGPDVWTGGVFGPEAGLMALGWSLLGCGAIAWWVKVRRSRVTLHLPLASYVPRPAA